MALPYLWQPSPFTNLSDISCKIQLTGQKIVFLGQESKRAWIFFNEKKPSTQLTSPQAWHECAMVLYEIIEQPHMVHTTHVNPQKARNAIDWIQFGNAQDQNELVGEHFIYAHDSMVPLLAYIFNRAICRFP